MSEKHCVNDQQILQEGNIEYQICEKEEGGTIIFSDDTDAFENDVLTNCSISYINRILIGLIVIHNKFGEGKIIDANSNSITVKFCNKEAKFIYPDAIGVFLNFKISRFQKIAERLRKNKERKKSLDISMMK